MKNLRGFVHGIHMDGSLTQIERPQDERTTYAMVLSLYAVCGWSSSGMRRFSSDGSDNLKPPDSGLRPKHAAVFALKFASAYTDLFACSHRTSHAEQFIRKQYRAFLPACC